MEGYSKAREVRPTAVAKALGIGPGERLSGVGSRRLIGRGGDSLTISFCGCASKTVSKAMPDFGVMTTGMFKSRSLHVLSASGTKRVRKYRFSVYKIMINRRINFRC
jgi:hypothetical protein